MLKYIETSVNDNVTNKDIEPLNNLVIKVKQRKEVNISYMKSWEYEKMIRKEAEQEGREEGIEEGMRAFITLCIDFHTSYEDTIKKVEEKFQFSPETAASYVSRYWRC